VIKNFRTLSIVSIALFVLLLISMQANITLSHESGQLKGKLEALTTIDSLDNYVTIKELCKEFKLDPHKVAKNAREGIIPAKKIKNTWFINKNIYKK
jgi:hypothetical protein